MTVTDLWPFNAIDSVMNANNIITEISQIHGIVKGDTCAHQIQSISFSLEPNTSGVSVFRDYLFIRGC